MESPPQPRCNRAVTKQIKGNATPKKHTNPMNASWKGTVEGLFFVEDSQKLKKTSSIRFLECKAKSNVNFLFLCLSNNLQHRGVLGMNQLTGKVCSTVFFFPRLNRCTPLGPNWTHPKLGALRDLRILEVTVQAKFRRPLLKGPSELHWSTNENRVICPPHILSFLSFLSSFLTQW